MSDTKTEILVVTSKVKEYVKKKGDDMRCSATVLEKLSELIREECDRAIEIAKNEKCKTLMDRHFFK
ncbi:MAG: hypothetical protein FJZ56_04450 [Chlamydiae bacterium]|nr:hypothetical protein [Chlamydiota bacterium]